MSWYYWFWGWRKLKPIYCTECGAKLVPNTNVHHYDPQTGTPVQPWLDERICPNLYCSVNYYGRH